MQWGWGSEEARQRHVPWCPLPPARVHGLSIVSGGSPKSWFGCLCSQVLPTHCGQHSARPAAMQGLEEGPGSQLRNLLALPFCPSFLGLSSCLSTEVWGAHTVYGFQQAQGWASAPAGVGTSCPHVTQGHFSRKCSELPDLLAALWILLKLATCSHTSSLSGP